VNVDPNAIEIVLYPDPALRRRAEPVESVDDTVRAVADRMLELMHQAHGVGLAAPQVGLSWRLFVANPSGDPGDDRVFVNPVLLDPHEEIEAHHEGCLSIPHVTAQIRRPRAIRIQAVDLEGQPIDAYSEDLAARVWQHEFDHLNGVLILDKMNVMDKMANKRAIQDLEAGA